MTHAFIDHLMKDHAKQRRLSAQLRKAHSIEERKDLRQAFFDALYPHLEGEDASIFSYLESSGSPAHEGALKAQEEHHVARVLLDELMNLDPGSDTFLAKAAVLDELNRHHLDEEEQTHFPRLEDLASQEKLDALFETYEQTEKDIKKQSQS
jgi:hemerythrin-like domain-containing protein